MAEQKTSSGFDFNDHAILKPIFSSSAFLKTDYPFLVSTSGEYLIHLYKEKHKIPKAELSQIVSHSSQFGYVKYFETKNDKEEEYRLYFKKIDTYNAIVGVPVSVNELTSSLKANRVVLLIFVLLGSVASVIALYYVLRPIRNAINNVTSSIAMLSQGKIPEKATFEFNDEIGDITKLLNNLIDGMERTADFAIEIGNKNLEATFEPLGPNDRLGNALINNRESLKKAYEEEQQRKEEDDKRNWVTMGLAKFGEILRQNNNNLQLLSDNVLQNLIDYLNANQGGLFTYNDDDTSNIYLELVSAFAYNRKKFKQKTIQLGEGLVGNCAVEKKTVHLREVPTNYLEITSGLGDTPPRSIIVVPLKLEDKIFGVIEIASLTDFSDHEIDFVEKIGESIASTLSAVRNNIKTNYLLEQSQQQREEMAAQEEEMRQNMEEMLATQEEMSRKSIEMEGMSSAINETLLFAELTEDGYFTSSNMKTMQLLEYSRTELEVKKIEDIIHPDDFVFFQAAWNEVQSGSPYKGTLRWVTRNDENPYILTSITPTYSETGELFKIYIIGQDVTESKLLELRAQKQAEEIEQSLLEIQVEQDISKSKEEEMSILLQALDQTCLVTEISVDGTITYINHKNVDTLGDRKELIEGRKHDELDMMARKNPEQYKAMWDQLLVGKKVTREFSLLVNNNKVWVSENYIPVRNSLGEISKIINIGIDISLFKQKEEELLAQLKGGKGNKNEEKS
jgi:PAS domain S-box-containing protein